MLSIYVCLDKDGEQFKLLKLGVPTSLNDNQIEDALGGVDVTAKESYLSCKNILVSTMKAGVNPRSLRDINNRRNNLRIKAAALANTDPEEAKRYLEEASRPEWPFEDFSKVLDEAEFAISLLNSNAYLIFNHKKDGLTKKTAYNSVGMAPVNVFSSYTNEPQASTAGVAMETFPDPSPASMVGHSFDEIMEHANAPSIPAAPVPLPQISAVEALEHLNENDY